MGQKYLFFLEYTCPEETEVLDSSTLDVLPSSQDILKTCGNEAWRAQEGKTGAEIIVDLKCSVWLETFSIINGFGDFGIKEFTLFGTQSLSDPWTTMYQGELAPGEEMTEKVTIHLLKQHQKYIKRKKNVVRKFMMKQQHAL